MIRGKTGRIREDVSLLGFGTMRLPMNDSGIDRTALTEMFDAAMAAGVNYYDTAYVYYQGESERMVGELLVDRYPRDSFFLADKMPGWKLPEPATEQDMWDIFETECRNLHTDHIDFYLIHSLTGDAWRKLLDQGVLRFLQMLRDSGRVTYLGFSFHDDPKELPAIAEAWDWDFAQIQLNYFDWEGAQNARAQYEYLISRGLPVISMEPVRGGTLAKLPDEAAGILKSAGFRHPAHAALKWVASLPGMLTVLSGMSDLAQMEDNCRLFSEEPGLTAAEQKAVKDALAVLAKVDFVPCTGCGYCLSECPQQIDIPEAMNAVNEYRQFRNGACLYNYDRLLKPGHHPADCLDCGACAAVCPQHITIPAHLAWLAGETDRLLK